MGVGWKLPLCSLSDFITEDVLGSWGVVRSEHQNPDLLTPGLQDILPMCSHLLSQTLVAAEVDRDGLVTSNNRESSGVQPWKHGALSAALCTQRRMVTCFPGHSSH